jgi:hypothetical protein
MTPEELAKILNEKGINHVSCKVNLNLETKECDGNGLIQFALRPDLVKAAHLIKEISIEG